MPYRTIVIDNGLTSEEKKLVVDIDNLICESKKLNIYYKEIESKLKSKRGSTEDKEKFQEELNSISFTHAVIIRKLNKKQEELYGKTENAKS